MAALTLLQQLHVSGRPTAASKQTFEYSQTRLPAGCCAEQPATSMLVRVAVQGGSMQCQSCKPDMDAAESDGVSEEMTSDMVDDMLGDMLGAFQALLNDPPPDATIDVI